MGLGTAGTIRERSWSTQARRKENKTPAASASPSVKWAVTPDWGGDLLKADTDENHLSRCPFSRTHVTVCGALTNALYWVCYSSNWT